MGVVLVTGSSGLIGSACVRHFARLGHRVHGVDSNARRDFFGADGDTDANRRRLLADVPGFSPWGADLRDRRAVVQAVHAARPDVVVHCAAQPSHDLATRRPVDDFEVNALGTLNLLEAVRTHAPEAAFVFASTNKVYGDAVNRLPVVECETRYEFDPGTPHAKYGLGEWMGVDASRHSVFGANKLAADVLVQEYAHTYGMQTGCFRLGCVTGAAHAGAELHGFLAYLVRCCREGRPYTIHGYQGKQVRDQLHAADVAAAFAAFARAPRPGAVYNLGGGLRNSASVIEARDAVQALLGKQLAWTYDETPRGGDHRIWYTDTARFRADYPEWSVTRDLDDIFEELCRQPCPSH